MAYLAHDNIPAKIFLELGNVDERKLGSIIQLLKQYSIVKQEGTLSMHGLVQEVKKLELEKQELEEKTLEKALNLLKEHMIDRDSAEGYMSHIMSVWSYASKYDKLIEDFIVKDIESSKDTYTTYFHLIAEGSSYEVVDNILNKIKTNPSYRNKFNKVINAKSGDGKTPLHCAARGGNQQIVELLIEKKANVNTRDKIGNRPLHLAAKNGHLEIVNALLEKNAEVNVETSPKYKFTPLHLAAQNGHLDIVKALLDKNANVNAETKHRYTPLHLAVENDCFKVIEVLLENDKINVNAETEYKLTALHFAAKKGYLQIVNALLEKGADVNAQDKDGFTPLHWAALNDHIDIVNKLLENQEIDANLRTTEGNTPLDLAEKQGHSEVVRALIANNANVEIKNEESKAESDLAHEKDHQEVKDYIVQHSQNKGELYNKVEQGQKAMPSKREGTGSGGQFYEIRLSTLFLFRGLSEKIDNFYLDSNMKKAGNFDDIVFKYKYKDQDGREKSKIIFLQAKHKENPENVKEKITIEKLLSKSEKGDFSLQKYFTSYLKIKQQFSEEKAYHPIFGGKFEDLDCDFIIYTNALPDFSTSKGGIETLEESIEKVSVGKDNILNLSEEASEGSSYYKLIFGKDKDNEIVDTLQYSSDCNKLARELVNSFSGSSIDINKPIFKSYHIPLEEKVVEKKKPKEGKFRDSFLDGDVSLSIEDRKFRSIFFKEAEKVTGKSENELKSELRSKSIKLSDKFWNIDNIERSEERKFSLPSDYISRDNTDDIEEFLGKLKLFVNQPDESKLGEIIKDKIQDRYKIIIQGDIDTIYSKVSKRVEDWWKEKGNRCYLTEKYDYFGEEKSYLDDLKRPLLLPTNMKFSSKSPSFC